jgi:hypothetical protein
MLAALASGKEMKRLTDHRRNQEKRMEEIRRRLATIKDYGRSLRTLAKWSWFLHITFRKVPTPETARERIKQLLADLEAEAGQPIGWVIVEARGRMNNRLHYHLLVSGVDGLDIKRWTRITRDRFGQTAIKNYNASHWQEEYLAENALAPGGSVDFGGAISVGRVAREQRANPGSISASADLAGKEFQTEGDLGSARPQPAKPAGSPKSSLGRRPKGRTR